MDEQRARPNVLVTGTPGTGKTTTAGEIAQRTGLNLVNISELVKTKGLHEGRDEERDCLIVDEDKVVDELEEQMSAGGNIIDHHTCDFFPERWFDLILVLRTDNTILYDRLVARGYATPKVQENVQAEIMQVVLEEARESYPAEAVHEVQSNTSEDMEGTIQRVEQWIPQWQADR